MQRSGSYFRRREQGFTLIEILVVLVIIGAMLTMVYQLAQSVWSEQLSGGAELSFEGFFKDARQKSLIAGKILTLEINLDKKTMGLRKYEPALENAGDPSLKQLTELRRSRRLDNRPNDAEKKEIEPQWVTPIKTLPGAIKGFYSSSGLALPGPILYIHFYPDGTSDSLVVKFNSTEAPFMFLPRQNIAPIYLNSIDLFDRQKTLNQPLGTAPSGGGGTTNKSTTGGNSPVTVGDSK